MDSLNLLGVYKNYARLDENYDMQKESCRNADMIWRYTRKTEKICLDPEFDPDGQSESLSSKYKLCWAE